MKDLGIMNGWSEKPKEYVECREAKHRVNETKLGNCYYEYECPVCKIRWRVDSSD